MTDPKGSLLTPVLPGGQLALLVGQESFKRDCPTGKRGRTKAVHPYKKPQVGQVRDSSAKAKASPPSLTRGGTPSPMAREAEAQTAEPVQPTEAKSDSPARRRTPPTGRGDGGPACIGCRHFTATPALWGAGDCAELGRPVASNNRRACGSYQIWHAARQEAS